LGFLILGALCLLGGVALLSHVACDEWLWPPATSARGRAEEGLGWREAEVVGGLVLAGLGGILLYRSARGTTWLSRAVVACAACALSGALFGVFAVPAVRRAREADWQRSVAAELQPLVKDRPVSAVKGPLAIRDKVLVWDCREDRRSNVQELLPKDRAARPTDEAFTVVLILSSRDEKVTTVDASAPGYRRDLKVGVVDWPEKKAQGVFEVRGEAPDLAGLRRPDQKGPLVGDTAGPLKGWIERQGQEP
jgi:hypothetical protein